MNATLTKTLPLLIRREFWEHRAFVIAPAVVAGICVFGAIFTVKWLNLIANHVHPDLVKHSDIIISVALSFVSFPFAIVMGVVTVFYLLDSLYADRKDRSILFWKSLPLSDTSTVAAKVLTATVVLPLMTLAATFVTSLLMAFILSLRLNNVEHLDIWRMLWQPDIWRQVYAVLLYGMFASALWYLPITAWLMLASAWARRAVLLWATLPPILAMFGENILFDTAYVAALLRYRLFGWLDFKAFKAYQGDRVVEIDGDEFAWPESVTEFLDPGAFFTSPGLWSGLVVAGLLFWATILIRRRRNEV